MIDGVAATTGGKSQNAPLDCCEAQASLDVIPSQCEGLAASDTDQLGGRRSPTPQSAAPAKTAAGSGSAVVILDKRSLIRDCLVRYFRGAMGLDVIGVGSLEECVWLAKAQRMNSVLLSLPGDLQCEPNREMISRATDVLQGIPFLVLCDTLSGSQITTQAMPSLCISTSMPLDVAIAAIRVMQSRNFVEPVKCDKLGMKAKVENPDLRGLQNNLQDYFTSRQISVIEALRKGKANKIIAYELNMKESTVKVHVRNIMRRLKASNRTEASYIASQLVGGGGEQYLRRLSGMESRTEETT